MQRLYELSRDEKSRTMAWVRDNDHCLAHFHSTIELVYVEHGELEVMQESTYSIVSADHLIVNSSYMLHGYSTPDSCRSIIVTIPLSAVPKLHSQLSQRRFAKSVVDARGMKECKRILRMMASPANTENEIFVNSLAEALLAFLIERIGLMDNPANTEADLMKRILIYLEEHCTEPLSVSQTAAYFGYSAGRFSHLFNERIGCAFTRYVNNLRCRRAQRMLLQENLPLIDVATACGFSSIRTFHRVYKEFTGETPRSSAYGANAEGIRKSV